MWAAERFRLAIATTLFDLGVASWRVTASFSLAALLVTAEPSKAVVAVADKALCAAKNGGREPVRACLNHRWWPTILASSGATRSSKIPGIIFRC